MTASCRPLLMLLRQRCYSKHLSSHLYFKRQSSIPRPFVVSRTFVHTTPSKQQSSDTKSSAPTTENDHWNRYHQKLLQKAQAQGLASVDDLVASLKSQLKTQREAKIKEWKDLDRIELEKKQALEQQHQQKPEGSSSESTQAVKRRKNPNLPRHVKSLDEIVRLDLLSEQSNENIGRIWNDYHSAKPNTVSGVMESSFFEKLIARSKQYPFFILPIPRDTGIEFFFLQFAGHQAFYTPLLEYKTKMQDARPHLTLTHHDDLAESKGLVLMNGDISVKSSILSGDDARLLVLQTQMFYVTGGDAKLGLVEKFHRDPKAFDFQDVINEMETLG